MIFVRDDSCYSYPKIRHGALFELSNVLGRRIAGIGSPPILHSIANMRE